MRDSSLQLKYEYPVDMNMPGVTIERAPSFGSHAYAGPAQSP